MGDQNKTPGDHHWWVLTTVDRLAIRWPSDATQEFEELSADQHIVIREETDEVQVVVPGRLSSL